MRPLRPIRAALGACAAASALLLAAGCGGSTDATAPSLSGRTLTGAEWSLGAEHGHWVVVAFQASTCIPCRKELPGIRAFAVAHPDVRVVSVGLAETPADFGQFLAPFHITWPAIPDRAGYLSDRWGVESLPVTVVVDPHGRVRTRFGTEVTAAKLAAAVA